MTGGRPGDEEIEAADRAAARGRDGVRRRRRRHTGRHDPPGRRRAGRADRHPDQERRAPRRRGGDRGRRGDPADLVVDATGRRSPLPRWLIAAGARSPIEEIDDSGFIYYGRHFRSADGSTPPAFGPLLQHYDSLSILTLPADNGTWGLGLITSAKDSALRVLKDPDAWTTCAKSYPLVAHWLDGEPIDDQVAVMAKLEDRHRSFCVDGQPVATGVLAVGDSWACTNPSVGRGISIGLHPRRRAA